MSVVIANYATNLPLNAVQTNLDLVANNPGLLFIDGENPSVNDLVIVKDQTNLTQNGLYRVVNTGSNNTQYVLTRDMNGVYYPLGTIFYATKGSVGSKLSWCSKSTDQVFTCGMSPLIFEALGQKIITDDSIIGSPYKVLVSEDTDNIIAYGSDGGILGRVNITDTTTSVVTEFTGFSSMVNTNVRHNLRGQVVVLEIDSFSGTSNATTLSATGVLPHYVRPNADLKKDCYVTDNGVEQKGTVILRSNGDIEIFVNISTAFMNMGDKGLDYFSCTYLK